MKYTAAVGDQRFEIELALTGEGAVEALVGGTKYSIQARNVEPGVYWLEWNHRSHELTVVANGDGYMVSINGRHIPVVIADARSALRKASQHGNDGRAEIRAPMPGKIVRVLVSEGSEVLHNQGLLVMEAMKMQNEIKSPKKGVLKKLGVKDGNAVNSGDLLAIVE